MRNFGLVKLALALAVLAGLAVSSDDALAADDTLRAIAVGAEGKISTRLDIAEIQVGVLAAAQSSGEAITIANEKAKALRNAAIGHGVAAVDIHPATVSLSLIHETKTTPKKEGEEKDTIESRIIGHQATLANRIVVRNISVVGDLLDSLVKAGANRFSGITFQTSKRGELIDQARALAIKNAKATAALMAKEAGVELGGVLRIEDGGVVIPNVGMRDMAAESIGMPVVPGGMEVIAQVRMVFAIK